MKKKSLALLMSLVLMLSLVACGSQSSQPATASSTASSASSTVTTQPAATLQIGMAYGTPNGTSSFGHAYAVVEGDVIVAAFLDEFQFFDANLGLNYVPNSDVDFGAGYAEGQALGSKRMATDYYSQLMADYAQSTVTIDANYDAIQAFVAGKTITEVEALANGDASAAVDAVSGATLVGTASYLDMIVQAAKNAQHTPAVEFSGDVAALELNVLYGAAHGTKCFTVAAALTCGDEIVLSYLDEFQFVSSSLDLTFVPNSDNAFANGYAEGQALISKRVCTDYYSELLASHANASTAIDANYDAIQAFANGKTVAEINAVTGDKTAAVDAVSGATLVDTANYLALIAEAATH